MKHIKPLFKFAKKEHRDSFCKQGVIRVGTLFEYRDQQKYSGKIYDKGEGQKSISVFFENENISANEIAKFGFNFSGEGIFNMINSTLEIQMNHNDCYIFCTSSDFFSDSLTQAIQDKYDACTLITQPELFFKELDKKFIDGDIIDFLPCLYGDRNIQLNWKKQKQYIKLFTSIPAALIKPKKYQNQREIRTIISPLSENIILEPKIKTINELTKYTLPIDFSGFDSFYFKDQSKKKEIIVRIIKKNNFNESKFSVQFPNEIFTPHIFEINNDLKLGFISQTRTNTYESPKSSNAEIGIIITDIGPIFCVNSLKSIERIEYFSK
jgi:hypothetical protein